MYLSLKIWIFLMFPNWQVWPITNKWNKIKEIPYTSFPVCCLWLLIFRSLGQLSLLYGHAIRGMSSGARVFEVRCHNLHICHLNLININEVASLIQNKNKEKRFVLAHRWTINIILWSCALVENGADNSHFYIFPSVVKRNAYLQNICLCVLREITDEIV